MEYINDIIEQQPIPEPEPIEPPNLTVDAAYIVQRHGKWYVDGYRDGLLIISMGGWDSQAGHVNAKLYDSEGREVEHTLVEPERSVDEKLDAVLAVAAISFVVMSQAELIDDITITENADLFPAWDIHWTGKAGSIVRDEGKLYRSIHDVGAGQNTKPSTTPSMWTPIGDPAEEWPKWSQPLGGHDAYSKGAKVTHKDKRWISDVDANTWEPGVHGWTQA